MHSWLPPLFLTLPSLARFQLLNIKLCWVISPYISPFHPSPVPVPTPILLGSPPPCPPPVHFQRETWRVRLRMQGVGGEEGVGLRNFHVQTSILYAAPAANNFFGVSVFLQTLLFTCIHFISVLTASANNLFYNFPTAAPLLSVKK